MAQYPCSNPRCPNKWHRVPTCPNARTTSPRPRVTPPPLPTTPKTAGEGYPLSALKGIDEIPIDVKGLEGLELIHYSHRPIERLHSVRPSSQEVGWKPKGLWISAEGPDNSEYGERDGWKQWNENEYSSYNEPYVFDTDPYSVQIDPDANILLIDSDESFEAFEDTFQVVEEVSFHPRYPEERYRKSIDWEKVAREYDGILITPHRYHYRTMSSLWYSFWDCASGCIWNTRKIHLNKQTP